MADNNHSKSQRAKVANVEFGAVTLQGLMLPNGGFAITVSQCAEAFQLLKNNATREVKDLLGEDSQLLKVVSNLHPSPVNCINLLQLEKLVIRLAVRGNVTAIQMLEASIGMTLTQRFSDAFGIKLDRAEYLRNRILDQKRKKIHSLFGDENMNKVAA